MKTRRPRFERIRFRAFDERARAAVRAMLNALPAGPHDAPCDATDDTPPHDPAAAREWMRGDAAWVERELARILEEAGPLKSPLSSYLVRAEGERLIVLVAQEIPGTGGEALPRWDERAVAVILRVGSEGYAIVDETLPSGAPG